KEEQERANRIRISRPDLMYSQEERAVHQYLGTPLLLSVEEQAERDLVAPKYRPISPDIQLLQTVNLKHKDLNQLIDLLEQGVYHEDTPRYVAAAAHAQIAKFLCLPDASYSKTQSERILSIEDDYLKKAIAYVPHIEYISITNNQILNKHPELADRVLDISKSMLIAQEHQKSAQTLNTSETERIVYDHRYDVIRTALRDIENIQMLYPKTTPKVINILADIASQTNVATYANEHSVDILSEIYAKRPDTLPLMTEAIKQIMLTQDNENSLQQCYHALARFGRNHPETIPDVCNVYKEVAEAKNTDFYTGRRDAFIESLVTGHPEHYEIYLDNSKDNPPSFSRIGIIAEYRPDLTDRLVDLTCRCIEDEKSTIFNPLSDGMEVLRKFVGSDIKYADRYLDIVAKDYWYGSSDKDEDMMMAVATKRPDLNEKINSIITQRIENIQKMHTNPEKAIPEFLNKLHNSLQKYINKDPKYSANAKLTKSFLNNLRMDCKIKSMPKIDRKIYDLGSEFKMDKHAKYRSVNPDRHSASSSLTKKQQFDFLKIARRYMLAGKYTSNQKKDFDEIKLVNNNHIIGKQTVDGQAFYFIVPVNHNEVADRMICLKVQSEHNIKAQKDKVNIQIDQFADNKIIPQIAYEGTAKPGFKATEEFAIADYCKRSFITQLTPSGRKLSKINEFIEKFIMSPSQYQAEKAKQQSKIQSESKYQKNTRTSDSYDR
ncbi:MAG: hypothetical protein J6N49_05435, partial [Alphaproteobacteria bacterium]|nr:hypothetical protein [Alphaproteobacteria bacterium]